MVRLRQGQVSLNGQLLSLRELGNAYVARPQSPERRKQWCQALDEVGRRMYDTLIAPLTSYLEENKIVRLIVSSHAGLERLPWNSIDYGFSDPRHYLAETSVLYKIPSITWLQYASSQDRADLAPVAFVSDRGSGLWFAAFEEQMVRKAMSDAGIGTDVRSFQDSDSFYDFLADKTRVHIACHGAFNDDDPFLTRLILDSEHRISLRLGDLLSGGQRLQPGCSVVLSACETGLVAPDQGGEYVSLIAGFMLAGAHQVIAPLWAVDDLPTSFLMGKFYVEWAARRTDAPGALNDAQCWLRRQTGDQLTSIVENHMHTTPIDLALGTRLIQALKYFRRHGSEVPYAHPHWWAAFEFTGLC